MGVHVLLEEMGVEYILSEVSLYATHYPSEFLAASPHGRVPALVHKHGTIFESGAISLFLTDAHLETGVGVAPDHPDRAKFLQWLFYLSSTVQPEVLIQFHPEHYFQDTDQQSRLKAASMKRLVTAWEVLDHAYQDGPWIIGNHMTAIDVCLSIQLQWPACFDGGIDTFPNLSRLLNAVSSRPAWKNVMRWHDETAGEKI